MKNVKLVVILMILGSLFCFISCTQNNAVTELGNLELSIDSAGMRGIQAISMETASYNVVVKNSSGAVVLNHTNSTRTSYSVSVPTGYYTAEVEALNRSGDVIGSGTASGEIRAGQTNRINVVVSEISGIGTVSLVITGNEGENLSYSVLDAGLSDAANGSLVYSDGAHRASINLQNGFYTLVISSGDNQLAMETVRVICGKTVVYSADLTTTEEGILTIENKIVSTPDIVIRLGRTEYGKDDTLRATAEIGGINGSGFWWVVDGKELEIADTYSDLEYSLANLKYGEHSVGLVVSDGTVIWAENVSFMVLEESELEENLKYTRGDDASIYASVLGEYEGLLDQAKAAATDSERFVIYAQAEATLLDSAVMIPNTTQGGAYSISRIAPRTVPYVQWGNDDDKLKGLVISGDTFLTPAERNELLVLWYAAGNGNGTYDPEAWLIAHGHTINKDYKTTFSTAPVTLDTLNTSSQSDTEILVNCTDNLVQYNNLGQMIPACAESWSVSDDGLTYTFKIRKGATWSTSEGTVYAEVKAKDFEAGFHHMLDAQAGLEWLVDGVIVGVSEYLYSGGKWDAVGYKAVDDYTLQVTLCNPASYFITMLAYSCFAPICESFYLAHGGVFGIEEYAAAYADTNAYTYGKATDVSSQVYNGAFLLQQLNDASIIQVVKNPNYYDPESVKLDSITWIYDNGENMAQFYKDVCDGVYAGCGLTQASGTLDWAKADGNFGKYAFSSDTTSTTYFCGLNLNRGTFALASGACASDKTNKQKIDTQTAMLNKNFRKALAFAWDKATQNATSRGADLATTNLRNMYCPPEFVHLSEDVTMDGKTFVAGTMYGEMVQYYLDQMGCPVIVQDGVDGWYHPEEAVECLAAAKQELGSSVRWPIVIDVVYYSPSANNTAQAHAYKQSIENVLGAENVTVNLVGATTSADFYACGYRASNGQAGNFDVFYGSGWGPDYGDPCAYLDTFRSNGAGYMTKVIGLF